MKRCKKIVCMMLACLLLTGCTAAVAPSAPAVPEPTAPAAPVTKQVEAPLPAAPTATPEIIEEAKLVNLLSMEGSVTVTSEGKELPAYKGMRLLPGDVLATGENAAASLDLDQGRLVMLSASTQIELVEAGDAVTLRLLTGSLINDITPGSGGYTLETPSITMGVLGTVFRTSVNAAGIASVDLFEGSVSVTFVTDEGEEYSLLLDTGRSFSATEENLNESAENGALTTDTVSIEDLTDAELALLCEALQNRDAKELNKRLQEEREQREKPQKPENPEKTHRPKPSPDPTPLPTPLPSPKPTPEPDYHYDPPAPPRPVIEEVEWDGEEAEDGGKITLTLEEYGLYYYLFQDKSLSEVADWGIGDLLTPKALLSKDYDVELNEFESGGVAQAMWIRGQYGLYVSEPLKVLLENYTPNQSSVVKTVDGENMLWNIALGYTTPKTNPPAFTGVYEEKDPTKSVSPDDYELSYDAVSGKWTAPDAANPGDKLELVLPNTETSVVLKPEQDSMVTDVTQDGEQTVILLEEVTVPNPEHGG